MNDLPSSPQTTYRRPPLEGWEEPRPARRTGGSRRSGGQALIATRRWPRRVLIWANIVVAVCLLGTATAYGYVQWRLGQIHREALRNLAGGVAGTKPFTMLIVGSDSRSALANSADNSQFGGSSATPGQRSDTIMLARVAPATRQIMLMSVPRDLWVNIPGHGMNRVNSAFDTGADLLIQTIETDFNIPINHYVEVNFDTFRDISSAVGGVSFYFPTPAKDAYSLLSVPKAGCVSLSGDQALAFVRARHYEYYQNGYWHFEAESDLARVQRQQAFIKKMIKKAEGEFTNPLALNSVIGGLTRNLTVDSGFSNNMLFTLAKDFRSVDAAAIPTLTVPNYPFTSGAGAVLGLQQPQAGQAIAAFNAFGTPPPATSRTTTPTTAPARAPSEKVTPSSVSVEVANGTGVSGQAGQMTQFLTGKGYNASTMTSSTGYTHATTEILYAPDSAAAAHQLATEIPGGATVAASSALAATPYNVEVITGSSYTAGAGTSGSSALTSPPATVPAAPVTTVPGQNATSYVMPGMPAGQTPPPC